MSLWNYATLGKNQLIMFAFDLYDNDGSGQIDFREVEMMLKEVYGRQYVGERPRRASRESEYFRHFALWVAQRTVIVLIWLTLLNNNRYKDSAHARKILEKVKSREEENFTVDTFSDFVQRHPALLFPAFLLQTTIQKLVVGQDFWEECAMTRINLSNGQYVTINQILKAHVSESAFNALVVEKGVIDEGESRVNKNAKKQVKDVLYASGNISERKFKRAREFSKKGGNLIVEDVRGEIELEEEIEAGGGAQLNFEAAGGGGGGGGGGSQRKNSQRKQRRSRENDKQSASSGSSGGLKGKSPKDKFKAAGVGVIAANRLAGGGKGKSPKDKLKSAGVGVVAANRLQQGGAGSSRRGSEMRDGSRLRIKSGPM